MAADAATPGARAPDRQPALAEAKNGLVTPLYFHRQVIRAEDLTLDRASHDAELARMRRLLHGWGVVAGLVPVIHGGILHVSKGYALTPTGDEVYLTSDISVEAILAAVLGCCGTAGPGCDLPGAESTAAAAAAESTPVTAWLIARPTREDAEPRPGIPDGCAHPANALFPSRRCAGVRLGLLCALPPSHTEATRPLEELAGIVCGPQDAGAGPAALPMPEIPGPEANFVVLGRLVVQHGAIGLSTDDRRTLLPLQTLQAWVRTQTCSALYYVNTNAQPGGEHEVHVLGCPTPAREDNRRYLGAFRTCEAALQAAAAEFGNVGGCANCLPDCRNR